MATRYQYFLAISKRLLVTGAVTTGDTGGATPGSIVTTAELFPRNCILFSP